MATDRTHKPHLRPPPNCKSCISWAVKRKRSEIHRKGAGTGEPAACQGLRHGPKREKMKEPRKSGEELAMERDREVLIQKLREGGKQKLLRGEGNEGLSQEKRVSSSLFLLSRERITKAEYSQANMLFQL